MAMQIKQCQNRTQIAFRPDDHEYTVAAPNGCPIKLYWSEMTGQQKQLQLEAERWQQHQTLFNPNGIA